MGPPGSCWDFLQNKTAPCREGLPFQNKLRWYPQQPQRLIFAGFPWIKWTWPGLASATFSAMRWTWLGFAPRLPGTFPGTFSGTFSGTLLNLTWLCTKADLFQNLLRKSVEPDLALHQSFSDLLRNLLRNPVEPDLAPAPVHTGAILGWRPH